MKKRRLSNLSYTEPAYRKSAFRKLASNTLKSKLKKYSKGDTIIEVLLAILIVSLVLSAAFVSVSQSLGGARTSQERGEAVNITQGQLETVRLLATLGNDEIFDGSANLFCLGGAQDVVRFSINALPPLDADNFGNYPSECRNLNDLYNISIDYDDSTELFIATIRWEKVGGGGRNEAQIRYRIHQGVPIPAASNPPVCEDDKRIALVLDRSGSMEYAIQGGTESKFAVLKRLSKKFVDSINFGFNQNSGAITTFSYSKWIDQPMTNSSDSLRTTIDGLTLSKEQFGTDFQMAMEIAKDEFVNSGSLNNPSYEPVIVLFTDGLQTLPGDPYPVNNELKSAGVRIYAIGLFEVYSQEAENLLSSLVGNGGYYQLVKDEAELDQTFADIASDLSCK